MRPSARQRVRGVNVLLHGAPGTGKTEFARTVAKELGARLYEVIDTDSQSDVEDAAASERLPLCAIAQRMLGAVANAMLVFDEADDAFPSHPTSFFGFVHRTTKHKSWTHRMLETTRTPTFWLLNAIAHIEPATLRRFDLVLEIQTPPTSVRARMFDRRLGHVTSPAWVERIAADERLTPADADRLAKVANLIGKRAVPAMEAALDHVLAESLQHRPASRLVQPSVNPAAYDLSYLNASEDLPRLAQSFVARPRGSICLYGAPGTGKTAFAHYLARKTDKKLHPVRASEILGMYVGETEKNLSRAFRAATRERAILFLDEADSFLQDRSRAHQTWEVTGVNELLVQLESFDGIFIAATNFAEALDGAAARRFSFKVRFDPMTAEQAAALFRASLDVPIREGAGEEDVESIERHLQGIKDLRSLTPGNFATVVRRLRLLGVAITPDGLLRGLRDEVAGLRRTCTVVRGFNSG